EQWDWFTQTMLQRLEENAKIIIIMTRWHTNDLAGRAKKHFEAEKKNIREVKLKAMQDDGTMLCDEILSKESYLDRVKLMGKEVASANYQQEPIDIKGKLYHTIKTYEDMPRRFERILNYTDTADEGKDNHCSIVAGEYRGELYVLDVIYTNESMETTEPMQAKQLYEFKVNESHIESNSGGRSFARTIERLLWEKYKSRRTSVKWFHQSNNKMARIISNSSFVMNHVYFPFNWVDKWPEF